MKICVAQTKPVKGDIQRNIEGHKKLIDVAVSHEADTIIFPELSLTGYEPTLAKELATTQDDSRFDDFQQISDSRQITIGIGVPMKNNRGICISMILFQPGKARHTYSKKYLHTDEEPFFVSGQNSSLIKVEGINIAVAICYEVSIPEHSENAFKSGAQIYIASVAKFVNGIDRTINTLSEIASKYSMMVLMSNCAGQSDGQECAGKSSVWNTTGLLAGQLDVTSEGILIIDTQSNEVSIKTI
jgi:predicted amidohydrolase